MEVPLYEYIDKAIISYSGKLRPHDGIYNLNFTSFAPVTIKFPDDTIIVSNSTKTYSDFWLMEYDRENEKTVLKGTKSFLLPYGNNVAIGERAEIH
jgi:hypothetical protein